VVRPDLPDGIAGIPAGLLPSGDSGLPAWTRFSRS